MIDPDSLDEVGELSLGLRCGEFGNGLEPIDPDQLDGQTFFVDSFFDVFFDITVTDVDSRPGRDFAGMADTSTIQLGDTTAGVGTVMPLRASFEDVDGDGDSDLILHFSTKEMVMVGALVPESVDALLTAEALDGQILFGMDSVRIVPKKNRS